MPVVPQERHVFVAILFFDWGRREVSTVSVVDFVFMLSFGSINLVLSRRNDGIFDKSVQNPVSRESEFQG